MNLNLGHSNPQKCILKTSVKPHLKSSALKAYKLLKKQKKKESIFNCSSLNRWQMNINYSLLGLDGLKAFWKYARQKYRCSVRVGSSICGTCLLWALLEF